MASSGAHPTVSLKIPVRASLRSELVPMLRLAVPVVMAELGRMTMGVWVGLSLGLIGTGIILLSAWTVKTRGFSIHDL